MILDTNALSAAADDNANVLAIIGKASELAVPVIVLGEYRYGVAQSRHRGLYESWLKGLVADCTVLDVNEETSHRYAEICAELRRAGTPIPTNDLWIAALCRQHSLPILTRDRHFDSVAGNKRIGW